MKVALTDQFNATSDQEFLITITNTPPYFLIDNLPKIRVPLKKTMIYNLTSIKDNEGNPITIKVCDLSNSSSVATNLPPHFIEIV
jgi:hypothetical protein